MPQTKQVEEFMKSIGPFYDFVDEEEEDNTNEEKKTKEEGEEETIPSVKRVTFSDQPSSNDDSDGELEFEDSYDNLPSSVTPLKVLSFYYKVYYFTLCDNSLLIR